MRRLLRLGLRLYGMRLKRAVDLVREKYATLRFRLRLRKLPEQHRETWLALERGLRAYVATTRREELAEALADLTRLREEGFSPDEALNIALESAKRNAYLRVMTRGDELMEMAQAALDRNQPRT